MKKTQHVKRSEKKSDLENFRSGSLKFAAKKLPFYRVPEKKVIGKVHLPQKRNQSPQKRNTFPRSRKKVVKGTVFGNQNTAFF